MISYRSLLFLFVSLFPTAVRSEWCGCETNMTLTFSTLIARHGIRSPYPPFGESECNTYTKYSDRTFPSFADWNMTEENFCKQTLTPHGQLVAPRIGEYYQDLLATYHPDFQYNCDTLTVFSDNSTRDIQTATGFLEGFGCLNQTPIIVAGADYLDKTMHPVVNDDYNHGDSCPTATEDEILPLFGGDFNFVTASFRDRIAAISALLQMASSNAMICAQANAEFNATDGSPCTMFETGSQWTGLYFQVRTLFVVVIALAS